MHFLFLPITFLSIISLFLRLDLLQIKLAHGEGGRLAGAVFFGLGRSGEEGLLLVLMAIVIGLVVGVGVVAIRLALVVVVVRYLFMLVDVEGSCTNSTIICRLCVFIETNSFAFGNAFIFR